MVMGKVMMMVVKQDKGCSSLVMTVVMMVNR